MIRYVRTLLMSIGWKPVGHLAGSLLMTMMLRMLMRMMLAAMEMMILLRIRMMTAMTC